MKRRERSGTIGLVRRSSESEGGNDRELGEHRGLVIAFVALLVTASLGAAPTQQPPATGVISGIVVDGSTGAPVPGAIVFIAAVPDKPIGPERRQITDERGRFAFVNLPSDTTYTIATSKFGYLDGGYGRDVLPTDALRAIALPAGAWVQNIRATVWKPGVISGAVRDEHGEPVVGVYVRALVRVNIYGRQDLASGPIVITDDRGEFRFPGLPPGQYLVQVPSVQSTVPPNTTFSTSRSNMPDGAVDIDERNRLVVVSRYPVPPPPVNDKPMAYAVAFHPSTPVVEQATTIDLKYAEDRSNVDITLSPVPTARISGTVTGPPEALAALTLRLLPVGLENLGLGSEMAISLVRPDGSFTFLNVPAGRYIIDAPNTVSELATVPRTVTGAVLPAPPSANGFGGSSDSVDLLPGVSYSRASFRTLAPYSARVPVTVTGTDVTGIAIRLRPHATMYGRVVVEADPARPLMKPPARFPLRLDPAGGEAHLGFPQNANDVESPAFQINDITPGPYFLRSYGYPGWIVKSVTWKGRDMTTTPFDTSSEDSLADVVVTITNAVPELTGAVRDGDGVKADSAIVVLFPAERAQWTNAGLWPHRLRTAALSNGGTYVMASAPAGDYLIAAIDRSHKTTWMDPAFLARLERVATRITLTWGGKTSQDLTAVGVR